VGAGFSFSAVSNREGVTLARTNYSFEKRQKELAKKKKKEEKLQRKREKQEAQIDKTEDQEPSLPEEE
jgi:cell division protein FtsB